MASAAEELTQTHAASITRASTLLVDDDVNNVREKTVQQIQQTESRCKHTLQSRHPRGGLYRWKPRAVAMRNANQNTKIGWAGVSTARLRPACPLRSTIGLSCVACWRCLIFREQGGALVAGFKHRCVVSVRSTCIQFIYPFVLSSFFLLPCFTCFRFLGGFVSVGRRAKASYLSALPAARSRAPPPPPPHATAVGRVKMLLTRRRVF